MQNQDLDNTNTLAFKVTDLHKQFGTESVLKGVPPLGAAVGDVISMFGVIGFWQEHVPALYQPAGDS
ncbi:MAG: hypothetical protein CM1200mP18_19570 [Gammaproteobacteria bacterium]|nr:MAG: hypothetical protein CM1200mP18_19570 [Gammaproteobacteria bacterium]